MRAEAVEAGVQHRNEFALLEVRRLVAKPRVDRVMHNQKLGRLDRRGDEQIRHVVADYPAPPDAGRREGVGEGKKPGPRRKRAHPVIPPGQLSAGQIDDDVQLGVQDAQLVNPGLVAVEDEEPHRRIGSNCDRGTRQRLPGVNTRR